MLEDPAEWIAIRMQFRAKDTDKSEEFKENSPVEVRNRERERKRRTAGSFLWLEILLQRIVGACRQRIAESSQDTILRIASDRNHSQSSEMCAMNEEP